MSKRKLSFHDQSSIAKWLIKEKKDIFEMGEKNAVVVTSLQENHFDPQAIQTS
jgi:hypothetical protein